MKRIANSLDFEDTTEPQALTREAFMSPPEGREPVRYENGSSESFDVADNLCGEILAVNVQTIDLWS